MKIRFLRESKNFGVRNCILCCRRLIENPTLTCSLPITLALPPFARQPFPEQVRFSLFTRRLFHIGNLFSIAGTWVDFVTWFKFSAPGAQAESLEAASLQLGALQAQAQYAPSALQGARAASRSAASCLVTAVQYTHGQQVYFYFILCTMHWKYI